MDKIRFRKLPSYFKSLARSKSPNSSNEGSNPAAPEQQQFKNAIEPKFKNSLNNEPQIKTTLNVVDDKDSLIFMATNASALKHKPKVIPTGFNKKILTTKKPSFGTTATFNRLSKSSDIPTPAVEQDAKHNNIDPSNNMEGIGISTTEDDKTRSRTPVLRGIRIARLNLDGFPETKFPKKTKRNKELFENENPYQTYAIQFKTDPIEEKLEKLFLSAPDDYDYEYPSNSIYLDPNRQLQDEEVKEDQSNFSSNSNYKEYEFLYKDPTEVNHYTTTSASASTAKALTIGNNVFSPQIERYLNPSSNPMEEIYPDTLLSRKRNEILLNIWTDTGPFSKIEALTIASSIMESGYDEVAMKRPLDMQKKDEFNTFCSNLNITLGLHKTTNSNNNNSNNNNNSGETAKIGTPTIDQFEYRLLWRVYGIFNNATRFDTADTSLIPGTKTVSGPGGIITDPPSNSTLASENGNNYNSKKKKKPKDAKFILKNPYTRPIMGQREEFLFQFNPTMLAVLGNTMKNFIITYGRFIELGKVALCPHLKNNQLNSCIHAYYANFCYTVPGTYISLPNHLESYIIRNMNESVIINLSDPLSFLDPKVFNIANNIFVQEEEPQELKLSYEPYINKNPSESESGSLNSEEVPTSSSIASSLIKAIRKKQKKKRSKKYICILNCRYDVVKRIATESRFRLVGMKSKWNIVWSDGPLPEEKLCEVKMAMDARSQAVAAVQSYEESLGLEMEEASLSVPLQKLNHFPGMSEVCRKDRLAKNLKKMQKVFPDHYDFFPETWTLPADLNDLRYHARIRKNCTFICKPETGCQGKGIFLIRNLKAINSNSREICQIYIPRPFLIEGYKFDLRLYVLMTSCDPLRIYLYNEGIARFATIKYAQPDDSNIDKMFMHLTNYSLNKYNEDYKPEQTKRKLSHIFYLLKKQGHDIHKLVHEIDSIVVKTMIAAVSPLKHYYQSSFPQNDFEKNGSMCFELLGFDILLDENLKPYLIEVNHSPSFNLDLEVDEEVKQDLLHETLSKIYLGRTSDKENRARRNTERADTPVYMFKMKDHSRSLVTPALQKQFRHESIHGTNFRLIYPNSKNSLLYTKFLAQAAIDPLVELLQNETVAEARATEVSGRRAGI